MKDETKAKEFASKAEERRIAAGIKAKGNETSLVVPNRRRRYQLVVKLGFESFGTAERPDVPTTETKARIKSAMQSAVMQIATTGTVFPDQTQNFHLKVEEVE